MDDRQRRGDTALQERTDVRQEPPALFHVILLNDDYSTMQFVVEVLEGVFQQSPAQAYRTMMQVHVNGRGIAGTYPWEVADTKADRVAMLAHQAGFPLRAAIEEA